MCLRETDTLPMPGESRSGIERTFKAHGCLCRWYGGHSITIFSPKCPVLNEHMNVPADLLGFDFAIDRAVNGLGA